MWKNVEIEKVELGDIIKKKGGCSGKMEVIEKHANHQPSYHVTKIRVLILDFGIEANLAINHNHEWERWEEAKPQDCLQCGRSVAVETGWDNRGPGSNRYYYIKCRLCEITWTRCSTAELAIHYWNLLRKKNVEASEG